MSLAARVNDMHTCPLVEGAGKAHLGGIILPPGSPTVLIGGMPAAVVGNSCLCIGSSDTIVKGSGTVFIGGKPAARAGDLTAHGGIIVQGCPTVIIG